MGDRLPGGAENDRGIGVVSFLTAVGSGSIVFLILIFLLTIPRNYLARVFKSKLYLAPPHERPERQCYGLVTTAKWLWNVRSEETIKRCRLNAYFFLRYLHILLAIFFPIAVVIPVLVPLNYIGGRGSQLNSDGGGNSTGGRPDHTAGLDTLAWGNVRPTSTHRYWAHLSMSVVSVAWVCFIFLHDMKRIKKLEHAERQYGKQCTEIRRDLKCIWKNNLILKKLRQQRHAATLDLRRRWQGENKRGRDRHRALKGTQRLVRAIKKSDAVYFIDLFMDADNLGIEIFGPEKTA
ncbi:hypothetical protein CEP52_017131 [Fusarium oligoseptatum]|uniref:CSC1/OSCA1-like N-terminal transmembrane domain-containing protein n=1 Tax=Fusarium oligoseptatum TaxID=2604345 RepID=A0A428RW23_9HYPO|nr:hypothetical protein CEP52_017131 [Fusarium oligoseptatum]